MATNPGFLVELGPICAFSIEYGPNGVRGIRLLKPGDEHLSPQSGDAGCRHGSDATGRSGAATGLVPALSGVEDGRPVPYAVADLAERLVALMGGRPQGLSDVVLDFSGTGDFARKVYEELRKVPAGETVTYAELAARVRRPGGARAVARAMATNRWPLVVPCHRVVGSGGRLTGFSGGHGLSTKARLLAAEGVLLPLPPDTGLDASLFEPWAWDVAVCSLASRDRLLAKVVEAVGSDRLRQDAPGNPFGALAEAVCYQQLAGSAAAAIFRKVRAALGGEVSPQSVLRTGESALRNAGLSGSKTATLLELAERVADGRIDLDGLGAASYEEVVQVLTEVKGIGPWTVQMFAIFHLGLPDIFPPSDLGIRKAVTKMLRAADLLSPEEVATVAERWAPLRTVATWYLWRSLGTVTLG